MTHLTEETINEYLDDALALPARAAAAAHLAGCADCAAQLQALRAVFDALETLPDGVLERDLVPGVVAATGGRAGVPLAVRLALLPQALATFALLASAWPLLGSPWLSSAFALPPDLSVAGIAQRAGAFFSQWAGRLSSLACSGGPFATGMPLSLNLDVPLSLLGLTLVSACLLWLVGNGLLLRPRAGSYKRRHS